MLFDTEGNRGTRRGEDPKDVHYLLDGCTFRLRSLDFGSVHESHAQRLESYAHELEELLYREDITFRLPEGIVFPNVKAVACQAKSVGNGVLEATPRASALVCALFLGDFYIT